MTEKRLSEIRERVEKATPGPWGHRVHPNGVQSFVQAPRLKPDHPYDIEILGEDRNEELYPPAQALADGDLIANAPTDLTDLLAYVERQRADLESVTATLKELHYEAQDSYWTLRDITAEKNNALESALDEAEAWLKERETRGEE